VASIGGGCSRCWPADPSAGLAAWPGKRCSIQITSQRSFILCRSSGRVPTYQLSKAAEQLISGFRSACPRNLPKPCDRNRTVGFVDAFQS
jgi:hypothetical protein